MVVNNGGVRVARLALSLRAAVLGLRVVLGVRLALGDVTVSLALVPGDVLLDIVIAIVVLVVVAIRVPSLVGSFTDSFLATALAGVLVNAFDLVFGKTLTRPVGPAVAAFIIITLNDLVPMVLVSTNL